MPEVALDTSDVDGSPEWRLNAVDLSIARLLGYTELNPRAKAELSHLRRTRSSLVTLVADVRAS